MALALAAATSKVRLDFWTMFGPSPLFRTFCWKSWYFYWGGPSSLAPSPLILTSFMDGPITVICIGHKTNIISRKDLPKEVKWTYFENWKHIAHIESGKNLVRGLIFYCITFSSGHHVASANLPFMWSAVMCRKHPFWLS